MRVIVQQTRFKADIKKVARSGRCEMDELLAVVENLALDHPLEPRLRDHQLRGEWAGFRECHVRPDWLLIYRLEPGRLVLVRTGTHADLFGK